MRKNKQGSILIEFVGSFLLFFLLIISILSLVNIVTAQARVHYALTETANTLSMYGYTLSAATNSTSKSTKDTLKNINKAFIDINNFAKNFTSGIPDWSGSAPGEALQSIISIALGDVPLTALKSTVRQMMLNNLATGTQSGEEYLRSVRITKLELTDFVPLGSTVSGKASAFYDYLGNIKLTVEYEIDYTFMGLPLPFEPKLKLTQSVKTKMWFRGRGYNG